MVNQVFKRLEALIFLIAAAAFIAGCSSSEGAPVDGEMPSEVSEEASHTTQDGMDMTSMQTAPAVPAGMAYLDGEEIRFIHTEASDADVAKLLSDMMSSPVIYVPALSEAPDSMLADVFVFKNGVEGMGP